MKKITLYKNTSNNILFGIFAEFRQYFGEVSHSAKCRFGEVSSAKWFSGKCHGPQSPHSTQCKKFTKTATIKIIDVSPPADTLRSAKWFKTEVGAKSKT